MYCRGEVNPITGEKIVGRHGGYRLLDEDNGDPVLEIKPEIIIGLYKLDTNGHIFINQLFSRMNND